MRLLAVTFSIVFCGCQCTPSSPMSVTLRLNNTSTDTLFVDDSDLRLGMDVQRIIGGTYLSFVEAPACDCQSCDNACSGATCDCPSPSPTVQRVPPAAIFERTWSGIVQDSATAQCGGFGVPGPMCLSPENAPYNETFNLHLCYALSAPGVGIAADGGTVGGTLPATGTTCADKEFRIEDGVAEISPVRGADCVSTTDCKGDGELCFSGACTASCPDNGFPTIGANWNVSLAVSDMGFFDIETDATGRTVSTGTGTISSAEYNGDTIHIHLTRSGSSGEALTASVNLTVPPGNLGPLTMGQGVSVKTIQPADPDTDDNAAVVIRDTSDAGVLLVAVDAAENGAQLTAADIAPFTVTLNSDTVGCLISDCGKVLFSSTTFAAGTKSVTLQPGASANVVVPTGTYNALNVYAARNDAAATCDLTDLRPYLLWQTQAPTGP